MKRPALVRSLAAFALGSWLGLGCSTPVVRNLIPNQRPTVRFTHAPISANPADPVFYAYRVFWAGDDADGRVDHFDYAIDPGPRDTAWVSTPRSEEVLFFRSTTPDGKTGPLQRALDYHVLVIRAVDDKGAMSARKTRAFYSYTVAPSVEIVQPHVNRFLEEKVPPTLTVHWQGVDPDGQVDTRPVRYRIRLLPFAAAFDGWMLSDPDSLMRRERNAGFAGWDSTSGDTTFARFTNLTPGSHYLFLVLALDEAGALTPTLSLDENALQVAVDLAATLGPVIHVFNSYLDYPFPSGGYTTDPLLWVRLQAPADRPITFNWDATGSAGASIERYRWGVDMSSVADETPRRDEASDYIHWSRGGALEQSCTLVGLPPGDHLLYIEARDNNGFASLGIVAFKLVAATLNQDLLIVDDTRRELDKFASRDSLYPYTDFWPSATELDTFLYARGNVPWRATQVRGSTSVPGLFAGYPFDTLGTRISTPASAVTLETLAKYRHVVWIVDDKSAAIAPTATGLFGVTALRFMSARSQASSVAAYVQAGGRLWLLGGGAGTVTIDAFNDSRNDNGKPVYDNATGELVPGRLMYDGAHWRSGFTSARAQVTVRRSPRAEAIAASPWSHPDRWTGGEVRSPDYLKLPEILRPLDQAVDPLPPTRPDDQARFYYQPFFNFEYMMVPNVVTEDVDPSDTDVHIASTLDTLLEVSSILLVRSPAPVMTWYHGAEANRFVFTGFPPWLFHREDAIALTDFVLQDLWGLRREPVDRGLSSGGAAPGRPAGVRAVGVRGTRAARRGVR